MYLIKSPIGLAAPFFPFFQTYLPADCTINPVTEALFEVTVPLFHHEN
jgi:hypothetical protein